VPGTKAIFWIMVFALVAVAIAYRVPALGGRIFAS
jgi:hypothetical protein